MAGDKTAVEVEVSKVGTYAPNVDAAEHARIMRKLDWRLLPVVTLFYLLSFMDRSNIGNAKVAGMEKDLDLVGLKYNIAAAVFFVTYCIGQAPSNIVLKLFRPSRWIPSIMLAWGLIMTFMCLVMTYPQLVAARVFLGLAESGLVPGVIFYISFWYPSAERAKRIAMFMSAGIVAGAFSGVLAFWISKMEGLGGLHGWQWIFCLEGLVTVLTAFAAPFFMYDYPETASFLTEAERTYVIELMKADSHGLAVHLDFRFALQALKDYKTYRQFIMMFCFVVPGYAIALFTPTIVHELGFSAAKAQLFSVPPFAAGCAAAILAGNDSDMRKIRGPYMVGGALTGLVGCVVLYTQAKPGTALLGVVLAAIGVYSSIPINFAWTCDNAGGDVKRGVAIAMVASLANTGGICASFIFLDPPRFHVGLGVCIGLLVCSLLTSLFTMWDYHRINKQKAKLCSDQGITDDERDRFRDIGDDSPLFRYTI